MKWNYLTGNQIFFSYSHKVKELFELMTLGIFPVTEWWHQK